MDAPKCKWCQLPKESHEDSKQFEPEDKPKKPGLWSKLGNRLGEAIGTWFAGRQ